MARPAADNRRQSRRHLDLGVFVVREPLGEILDNESFEQFQKRIHSYPIELDAFFGCCMQDGLGTHEIYGSTMLSSTVAIQPLSVLVLATLEEEQDFTVGSEEHKLLKYDLED